MTDQVVLLAGGLGTRLGEHARTLPKPLIPVAGKPFIQYVIEEFAHFGLKRYLVLGGHLGIKLKEFFADGPIPGVTVDVIVEPEPLGTAGALRYARSHLDETFLMANADSLFAFDYADFLRPPGDPSWLGKLALRWIPAADRFGVVELEHQTITGFCERGDGGPALINGGIYLLRRSIVDTIPPGQVSLEASIFPPIASRSRLFGEIYEGPFIDIGMPSSLASAEAALSEIAAHRLRS
jgi:NDP-sugar pyrophosphorylase family protein